MSCIKLAAAQRRRRRNMEFCTHLVKCLKLHGKHGAQWCEFFRGRFDVKERWTVGNSGASKSEGHQALAMTKAWVRVRLRSTSGLTGQSTPTVHASAVEAPEYSSPILPVLPHMLTRGLTATFHGRAALEPPEGEMLLQVDVAATNGRGSSSDPNRDFGGVANRKRHPHGDMPRIVDRRAS